MGENSQQKSRRENKNFDGEIVFMHVLKIIILFSKCMDVLIIFVVK